MKQAEMANGSFEIGASKGRRTFLTINSIVCMLVGLLCLAPFVHILALSFSDKTAIISGQVILWPVSPVTDNYMLLMQDRQFFHSYFIAFIRTVLGWAISIVITIMASYPMSFSERKFGGRKFFRWFFIGTMIFYGGMIPAYLVVQQLGLINTMWALVLPCAVSAYNIMLMSNSMRSIPEALAESAYIDGCNHFRTLWYIILPLSKASVATISLFIILMHWNSWFDGMIYIRNADLKPLQTYLRSVVIVDAESAVSTNINDIISNATSDGAASAKIFASLLPIMVIYPFLQKYFVKGMTIGSVKE